MKTNPDKLEIIVIIQCTLDTWIKHCVGRYMYTLFAYCVDTIVVPCGAGKQYHYETHSRLHILTRCVFDWSYKTNALANEKIEELLHSDDHQFQQHQQNEQSYFTSKHLIQKYHNT